MKDEKYSLKVLRAFKNMTQIEFAEYLGIDYRRYQKLELYEAKLTAEELMIISDKMQIMPVDIKIK